MYFRKIATMKRVAKIISIIILILLGLFFCNGLAEIKVSFTLWELFLGVGFCFVAYMFYILYYISVVGDEPNDKPNDKHQDAFNSSVISTVGMVLIMFSIAFYVAGNDYLNEIKIPKEIYISGVTYEHYGNKGDAYAYIIVGVLVDVLALMLPFMMKPDPEE